MESMGMAGIFGKPYEGKILFIGVGAMGKPMAENLIKAGYSLTVWDIDPKKTESLERDGAKRYPSLTEAAKDANMVITMLATGEALTNLYFNQGVVEASAPNALFIDMGTNDPNLVREHAEKIESTGRRHIDAPVSGGPMGAKDATLAIFAAGVEADVEEAKSLLMSMGNVSYLGGHGNAQVCKLCNNIISFETIYAITEALYVIEKANLDPQLFLQAIKGGMADIPAMRIWGPNVIEKNWHNVKAGNNIAIKDCELIHKLTESLGIRLKVFEEVREKFQTLVDKHEAIDLDVSAVYLVVDENEKN